MTDEVQSQAQGEQIQPEAPASAQPTVEDIEAKRNAENLARAKEGGYQDPPAPTISERVQALVDGVAHAMAHNAPISREHFEEMKALLGHREPDPAQGEQPAA